MDEPDETYLTRMINCEDRRQIRFQSEGGACLKFLEIHLSRPDPCSAADLLEAMTQSFDARQLRLVGAEFCRWQSTELQLIRERRLS